jgi:hypothetical protein
MPAEDPGSVDDRDAAILLGATEDEAQALQDRLDDAGLQQHGLAVVVAAVAARQGIDLVDAVRHLVAGAALPRDLSDYELRVAAQEAEAEIESLLDGR